MPVAQLVAQTGAFSLAAGGACVRALSASPLIMMRVWSATGLAPRQAEDVLAPPVAVPHLQLGFEIG